MRNNLNSFFSLPSSIEPIDLSYWGVKQKVYVKRDDQIHNIVSGNKWRKLKYNLAHYNSNNFKGVVTFGGAHSNHILAASFIAEKCKIPIILVIRGEKPNELSPTLKTCVELGAKLWFISREEYRNKDSNSGFFSKQFPNYFIIPEGGANRYGIDGCRDIIKEITIDFQDIYCDVGTGTTMIGIHRQLNKNQRVNGVVVLKGAEYLDKQIRELISNKKSNGSFRLLHEYHFGGYAKNNQKLIEFMRVFYKITGIKTDPIYSAKLFYGMIEDLKSQQKRSVVVALHSGGLQGLEGFEKRYKVKVYE